MYQEKLKAGMIEIIALYYRPTRLWLSLFLA